MAWQEKILAFLRSEECCRPLSAEDLAQAMHVKKRDRAVLQKALDELEKAAVVIKTRFDLYGLPDRMNLIVGRFDYSGRGFGFVIPDDHEQADIFIPAAAMATAMHGDKVAARVHRRQAGKSPEGEIVRIVERANQQIVGTFHRQREFGYVEPDDKRLGMDLLITRKNFGEAKDGQKVVAEIVAWPDGRKSPEGRVAEVLGSPGDPGLEILSIIRQHGLPDQFPVAVQRAAEKVPERITEEELQGREDLRALQIVTIDSEDARDLDDAVHVLPLDNGHFQLGVHIADVSWYVKDSSPIDAEANDRGTSVYLVDRVIPMLPERLSNGICSLNPHIDRLTLSCEMEINTRGRVVSHRVFPSVIRTHTRLSYNIVRGILAEGDAALAQEHTELVPQLQQMEKLAGLLRKRRMGRGAIDFDFPELKVKLDETGKPIAITQRIRSIAESIIEEFMLIANETVAQHMSTLKWPFIFRIHEEPDEEKIVKLAQLLHNAGWNLPHVDNIEPVMLQKALKAMAGRPEERMIATVMLRSLKQARYAAENEGHFGLAAPFYTHFTSPIRRYPDLIVHRLLRESWRQKKLTEERREALNTRLPEIAKHASERERAAAEAERDTVDLKKAEYMAGFIGERFAGHISGVTAFGLFVELENGIEGLVHVSSLIDDYYQFNEDEYLLVGERTGKTFRLGDELAVEVLKVDLIMRAIDFVLPEQGDAVRARGWGKPARMVREAKKEPAGDLNRRKKRRPSSKSKSGGKPAASTGDATKTDMKATPNRNKRRRRKRRDTQHGERKAD